MGPKKTGFSKFLFCAFPYAFWRPKAPRSNVLWTLECLIFEKKKYCTTQELRYSAGKKSMHDISYTINPIFCYSFIVAIFTSYEDIFKSKKDQPLCESYESILFTWQILSRNSEEALSSRAKCYLGVSFYEPNSGLSCEDVWKKLTSDESKQRRIRTWNIKER